MSLEIALQENTAAIKSLIAVFSNQAAAPAKASKKANAPQPQTDIAVDDAANAKATVANNGASSTPETTSPPPVEAAAQVNADPTPSQQESGAAGVSEPTYQDTAAYITRLSREKGRDAAVTLLKEFNAAKLPDVAPADFAAIIARANELLGA